METNRIISDALSENEHQIAHALLGILDTKQDTWVSRKELEKLVQGLETCFKLVIGLLVKQGLVIELGQLSRVPVYSLMRGKSLKNRQVELTKAALMSMSTPGNVKAMPLSEKHQVYTKVIPTKLRPKIKAAVAELKKEYQVVPLKASGRNYFLYAEALRSVLNMGDKVEASAHGVNGGLSVAPQVASPADEVSAELDVGVVRNAYKRLSERRHLPDVLIYDLQHASQVPLETLLRWLEDECKNHRVIPSRGEPTAVSSEVREASLTIGGRDFLMVRLEE